MDTGLVAGDAGDAAAAIARGGRVLSRRLYRAIESGQTAFNRELDAHPANTLSGMLFSRAFSTRVPAELYGSLHYVNLREKIRIETGRCSR